MKASYYTLLFFALFQTACIKTQVKNAINTLDDINTLRNITKEWNACLIKKDFASLPNYYADEVSVYGANVSKGQLMFIKRGIFNKSADFNQSITGEIKIIKIADQRYTAVFPKHYYYCGKNCDTEGYLLFQKNANNWQITSESDNVPNKNISLNPNPANCTDYVIKILMTSPAFLTLTAGLKEKIIKNGGISYGVMLEGSPNPEGNKDLAYSETYDFNLHETYIDHAPVIARFSFNPINQHLYQYNVINDSQNSIDFDQSLLQKFNEKCDHKSIAQ